MRNALGAGRKFLKDQAGSVPPTTFIAHLATMSGILSSILKTEKKQNEPYECGYVAIPSLPPVHPQADEYLKT